MNVDNGDRTKTQTGHLPSRLCHSLGSTPLKKTADRTYMMMHRKGSKYKWSKTTDNNTH